MGKIVIDDINFGSIPKEKIKSIPDKVSYIELIEKILNCEIDTDNTTFSIISNEADDNIYYFDNNIYYISADGNTGGLFNTLYNDKDIDKVVFKVNYNTSIDDVKKVIANSYKAQAKQNIINMLEEYYMDLDMEIDNCQGAMDNLEEAFEELNIIKELVKHLDGDIDAHKSELLNKWYNKHTDKNKIVPATDKDEDIIKYPVNKVLYWENKEEFDDIKSMFKDVYDNINKIGKVLKNLK